MARSVQFWVLMSIPMLGLAGMSSATSLNHVLAVDLRDGALDGADGLDFTGYTATGLLQDGTSQDLRWTRANTDDAFVVVDATALRAATGYDIASQSGVSLEGDLLFRNGLQITLPGEDPAFTTDGWNMLSLFDSNGDGKMSASDSVWDHLKLFTDSNADGTIGAGELRALGNVLKEFFETGDIPTEDQFGNIFTPGGFVRLDDSTGDLADVQLQSVPEPGTFALVALGLVLVGGRRTQRRPRQG